MTPSAKTQAQALRAHWASLAPREQTLVLAAAAIVSLALLWWLLLAPALAQLRASPQRHAAIDAQLQQMQTLQAEAMHLKGAPRTQGDEALRALQGSLAQQLGQAAQMQTLGDRSTITLKAVPAEALAQWLAQVRGSARAVPLEARLVRSQAGAGTTATGPTLWDGTLVLALPAGEAR